MSSPGSVSRWIGQLQAGDSAAAQRLWQRYFQRMVRLARKKLRAALRRAADEEDVALSAFDSFCRGARHGRFPRLRDRDNLWQLLFCITERKAADYIVHERRRKRGSGAVRGESALIGSASFPEGTAGIEQIVGPEPTPEFAAQVAEEYQRLLECLGSDVLRSVALWKMEGYTSEEIAAKLDCVPRTVERRLRAIREIWAKELGHE